MKERALASITTWFPYVLAALLPLAGLVLAGAWWADGRREGAQRLLMAAVLGAVVWVAVLSG